MTQKNSENIYKALKEEERTLLEKNVTWILVLSMRGTQYHRPSWCEMTYPIMCRKAHYLRQQVVQSLNLLSRKLLRPCPLWKWQEN